MKLASLNEGRDGKLVVVSKDLAQAKVVGGTLQQALDDWQRASKALQHEEFNMSLDTRALGAPLPRAYQWADGSAYVTHVELVPKARGAEMPASFWTDPLMYQGGPEFTAPTAPI